MTFIVADPWQGLGLGTMMVEHVINICREKNFKIIYSFILSNNYSGIRFLKKMGFNIEYLSDGDVKGILNLEQN